MGRVRGSDLTLLAIFLDPTFAQLAENTARALLSFMRMGTSRAIVAAPNLHNVRAEAKTAARLAARLESLPDRMKTAVAKVLQGDTLEKATEKFSIEKDISYSALQR
jgi:hypothetical protein